MLPTAISTDAASDPLTAQLLNEMQERFPLVAHPYATLGERIGLDESATFARATAACEAGLVRRVGPIFDTRSLGYASSLVAMRTTAEGQGRAAAVINAHRGVSHNYVREHEFNLWFTIAVPPGADIEAHVDEIRRLAGADRCWMLPTLRLFKIGMVLDMTGKRRRPRARPAYAGRERDRAIRAQVDEDDRAFIRASQQDWARSPDPFMAIARVLGWDQARVIERAQALQASGHLRRFAAILNHRRAGFAANGMTAWAVPEELIDEVGRLFASYAEVTHCYLRPTYPDWPYNIFAMLHGRTRPEVERFVRKLMTESGLDAPQVLFSTVELKKERLRYFTPEHDQWQALCAAAATAVGAATSTPLSSSAT